MMQAVSVTRSHPGSLCGVQRLASECPQALPIALEPSLAWVEDYTSGCPLLFHLPLAAALANSLFPCISKNLLVKRPSGSTACFL